MKALNNQILNNVYGMVQDYLIWDYKTNEGFTYRQISDLMGLCEKAVYNAVRALRKLEKEDERSFDQWYELAHRAYEMLSENVKWGENDGKERA